MKRIFLILVTVVTSLAVARLASSSSAMAIEATKIQVAPVSSPPNTAQSPEPVLPTDSAGKTAAEDRPPTALRVEIPIAWQRTKARMAGAGASTVTESFREVWTLELRPDGFLSLVSPRAAVPVYPSAGTKAPRNSLPGTVVLSEADFGRLVGVNPLRHLEGDDADAADPVSAAGRPIMLNLAKPTKNGFDVSLAWTEEEHYAVHLDISASALF